jgi:hypothetical protein
MHELLIFFSTLGGLMFFGAMGFILGPILAALFVTAWEVFGNTFRSALAEPDGPTEPNRHRLDAILAGRPCQGRSGGVHSRTSIAARSR